jgi:hypothetical protein
MSAMGDVPLTIITGDDRSVTITFTDKTTGSPVNITGRTYRAQIRRSPNDSTILASWTCTITSGSTGVLTLTMSHTVTATLTAGYCVWDLEETTSGGLVSTPLGGRVTVLKDVSR